MAKKDSNADASVSEAKANNKKTKKKKLGCLIPIIISVLLIGGLFTAIFLNLFGMRDFVANVVSDVPVLNTLIPLPSSDEGTDEPQPATRRSSRDYEAQIVQLEEQINRLTEQLEQAGEKSDLYVAEINRLSDFEEMQVQFRQDKEEFDRMIAQNDLSAFARFFEQVSPETAESLYRESVVTDARSAELTNYVNTITTMDETAAARMIEQMLGTDMDLVVLILGNVDNQTRGTILGTMSAANAASVYKQLAPE